MGGRGAMATVREAWRVAVMRWLSLPGRAVVDDRVELHLERPCARNQLVVEVAEVDDADRDNGRVLRAAAAEAE
eukprot:7379531-Prymnesium_polylepis.1